MFLTSERGNRERNHRKRSITLKTYRKIAASRIFPYAVKPFAGACFLSLCLPGAALADTGSFNGLARGNPPVRDVGTVTVAAQPGTDPAALSTLDWRLDDIPVAWTTDGQEARERQTGPSPSPDQIASLPYGPADPQDGAAAQSLAPRPSFARQLDTVKWEAGALLAYMTITQAIVTKDTQSFHFQDEGWFGKDTKALGMDKLTHAFNAYMIADFLQHRIEKRTGGPDGTGAITAALVSSALQFYSELWDAHKVTSGFSVQDVAFNSLGAAFSVLRNSVPGLRDKLDFRLLIVPNHEIYTFKGQEHYAQQRYLFALTLAGFRELDRSPLRFVELHAGYYGDNFTARDEAAGRTPKRKLFFGVGLNLKELFFRSPRSRVGRWVGSGLDYIQIPYTAIHHVE